MNTSIKNLLLLPTWLVGFGLMLAGQATAQTFMTVHSFTALDRFVSTNSEGVYPYAGLVLSGNTLYGTAQYGGSWFVGTVFAVDTNGTGVTNLHSFNYHLLGSDGAYPEAALVLSGNTLYGTAPDGSSSGAGTVFKVNTDGTGFTNLYSFTATSGSYPGPYTNSDGTAPYGGLVLLSNILYGTALSGGCSGNGTVFAVNTNGTGFSTLHCFTAGSGSFPNITNSDGANPYAGLVLSGNTLYGTTYSGGDSGAGTVFKLSTDGTGFTNLHSFTGTSGLYPYTNSDGSAPHAGLMLAGNTLYGTALHGGNSGYGTVFAVNTNGTGFTNLHSFAAISDAAPYTNSDGASPWAGLILSSNTLYGTAYAGGSSGNGTVFAVNTNGTGFMNLHNFTATPSSLSPNSDGAKPYAGLILSGNNLYGTAHGGGSFGYGTVFRLSLGPVGPPQLTIIRSAANVILTWPTNAAGFTLQSATNLVSPPVWITNPATPIIVNGQNTMTNPSSGTRKFFRLIQ